jgi:type VI secretion system secreted protein Hcp
MAYEFYVSIEGTKQGKFKGESARKEHKDKLVGIRFNYQIKSPRDAASGQATGKRQHHPVTITKEWGAATPQLFQALVTNEVLKTVQLEFVQPTATGKNQVYHTIKLINAVVSDIKQYSGEATDPSADIRELEDISFTFERIELENIPGKAIATDDWSGNQIM